MLYAIRAKNFLYVRLRAPVDKTLLLLQPHCCWPLAVHVYITRSMRM